MKRTNKISNAFISALLICLMFTGQSLGFFAFCGIPSEAQAARQSGRNVVVVIDPGHGGTGGTNEGAIYNGFIEKQITLATAAAMKQILDQFEGITTYLTRQTDVQMTLEERARYAKSVNADFLYSLHYNASAAHQAYGSEVWIPSAGSLYVQGYAFAAAECEELGALGLYQRGIKTRIGSHGDYYGIIRHCTALGIPSVIIEHCHLDHGVDVGFMRGENPLQRLGYADAIAVAKYFGLRSQALELDFSNYKNTTVATPATPVGQDVTPPDLCNAVKKSYDANTKTLVMDCTAFDKDSPVIYYSVSFNGGASYTILFPWNRLSQTNEIAVQVPNGATSVIFRAYNQYDKYTDSTPVLVY